MNEMVTNINNNNEMVIAESNFETLLPIERLENGMKAVDARKLHEVLGSLQHYSDWIKNRIKKYGFKETFDFIREHKLMRQAHGNLMNTRTEYYLTVEMAKELAMIENNEMGTKVRRYFIEVEKHASEIVQYEGGKEIDLHEVVNQIVVMMGERFVPKEAHDRILELELKVQRLEYEAEIARLKEAASSVPAPVNETASETPTLTIEPTKHKPKNIGQVAAFPELEGMTVSKAVKRLVSETGVKKAEVIAKLETLGFAVQGTNGTHRWEYTWAFDGGFGGYDANKNFKLNNEGYAEILKNM